MGIVHIVGAGCGDYDLITLRGRRLLEKCGAVVYDSLIDKRLLDFAPDTAEKICVGKRAGHHSETQENINKILIKKALEGKTIVRLKGGDPFVFGRGGEEISELEKNNIPYTVVPGISSCIAVPELGGIPVTHRKTSRGFHVIAAHTADGEIDFAEYARLNGTLVFLMGLSVIEKIADGLIKGGMSRDIGAAVIYSGASANQKVIRAPLCDIARKCGQEKITAPAVIVVGETAAMDFVSKHKFTVSVCGTARFADKLRTELENLGAEVQNVCDMRVQKIQSVELDNALRNTAKYKWIVLTSANGARIFLDRMKELRLDIRSLSGIKTAAIGSGTAEFLMQNGIYPDLIPDIFTSDALGKTLAESADENERILILRAKQGSRALTEALDKNNITYDDIKTYDVIGEVLEECVDTDYMIFASASGVKAFFEGGGKIKEGVKVISIGNITAAKLNSYGISCDTAKEYSIEGIIGYFKNNS